MYPENWFVICFECSIKRKSCLILWLIRDLSASCIFYESSPLGMRYLKNAFALHGRPRTPTSFWVYRIWFLILSHFLAIFRSCIDMNSPRQMLTSSHELRYRLLHPMDIRCCYRLNNAFCMPTRQWISPLRKWTMFLEKSPFFRPFLKILIELWSCHSQCLWKSKFHITAEQSQKMIIEIGSIRRWFCNYRDEPKIDSDLPTSVMKSSEQMQLETTDLASTSLYISARTSFLPLWIHLAQEIVVEATPKWIPRLHISAYDKGFLSEFVILLCIWKKRAKSSLTRQAH